MQLSSPEIFTAPASDLIQTPSAPEDVELAPLIGDMTQQDFAKEMAALIAYILDTKENEEEEKKDEGFVLGGGSSGGGIALDAILMG